MFSEVPSPGPCVWCDIKKTSHCSSCNQNEALIPVVLNLILHQQNKNNRFTSSFVPVFLAPSCDALTGAETTINNQLCAFFGGFEVGVQMQLKWIGVVMSGLYSATAFVTFANKKLSCATIHFHSLTHVGIISQTDMMNMIIKWKKLLLCWCQSTIDHKGREQGGERCYFWFTVFFQCTQTHLGCRAILRSSLELMESPGPTCRTANVPLIPGDAPRKISLPLILSTRPKRSSDHKYAWTRQLKQARK